MLASRLLRLVLSVPYLLYTLWITVVLWKWFAVPLGLPVLSMVQVYGLRLAGRALFPATIERASIDNLRAVFSMTEHEKRDDRENDEIRGWLSMMLYTITYGLSLLFGWVAHTFFY